MKKLSWVWLLLGLGCGAQGQGTVNFSNGAATNTWIMTNYVFGSTGWLNAPSTAFYFALFVAPSTITSLPPGTLDPTAAGFTITGLIGTNTGFPGRFTGNTLTNGPLGAVAINSYATGTTASFVVVGWSADFGTTWWSALDAMRNNPYGFWGVSEVAQVQLGGGALPPGNIFGSGPGQIPGFTLTYVALSPKVWTTIQTSPPGLLFTVDSTSFTTAQTFTWYYPAQHTLATASPQSSGPGEQYAWTSWSDGGAISHTVSPSGSTTYTANFTHQYYLAMSANAGGTVSPGNTWVDSGAPVVLLATPNPGFRFDGWSGSGASAAYTGTNNPVTVTMTGPISETAKFVALPQMIPRLDVVRQGNYLLLMWPTNDPAFKLAYSTSLPATTWVPDPAIPAMIAYRFMVVTMPSNRFMAYRLQK